MNDSTHTDFRAASPDGAPQARRPWRRRWLPIALIALGGPAPPAMAQPAPASGDALQAQAVASFRQARFSEVYGRFIGLADAGHAPAATLALWMYLNGPSLFGKDWDSTQEQLAAWAQLARQPVPALVGRGYTPATLLD